MKKAIVALCIAMLVVGSLLVVGCGTPRVDLSYSDSAVTPVVTYNRYQAIAPIYNSSAPVTIIYGDQTAIEKKDSYEFTTGELAGEGLDAILQSLYDDGFFELDETYTGEPMAGGVTETLTVKLSGKTYKVSVQGGQGPSNWEKIVSTVTDLDTSGSQEYIPNTILLFANAEPEAPGAPNVMEWPGISEDLAQASSTESSGRKLEGKAANVAWKAIQGSMKSDTEVTWKANGSFYTYVYAVPVFPGISEQT
jgi:hypothetical protein